MIIDEHVLENILKLSKRKETYMEKRFKGASAFKDTKFIYQGNDSYENDMQRISASKQRLAKYIRERHLSADIVIHEFRPYWHSVNFTFEEELYQVTCECGEKHMKIFVKTVDDTGELLFSDAETFSSQKKAIEFIEDILAKRRNYDETDL